MLLLVIYTLICAIKSLKFTPFNCIIDAIVTYCPPFCFRTFSMWSKWYKIKFFTPTSAIQPPQAKVGAATEKCQIFYHYLQFSNSHNNADIVAIVGTQLLNLTIKCHTLLTLNC